MLHSVSSSVSTGSVSFYLTSVSSLLSASVLARNQYLSMDPALPGVFSSPYPFGIDPVRPSSSSSSLSWLQYHCIFVSLSLGFLLDSVLFVSSTDLGYGQQQTNFPELVQDEDVSHHWCHSHDFWSLFVIFQLLVGIQGCTFLVCVFCTTPPFLFLLIFILSCLHISLLTKFCFLFSPGTLARWAKCSLCWSQSCSSCCVCLATWCLWWSTSGLPTLPPNPKLHPVYSSTSLTCSSSQTTLTIHRFITDRCVMCSLP